MGGETEEKLAALKAEYNRLADAVDQQEVCSKVCEYIKGTDEPFLNPQHPLIIPTSSDCRPCVIL